MRRVGRARRVFEEAAGGLPRAFWFLWVGMLVNRIGGFVLPLMALYLSQARGFSDEHAGVVVGLYGAGSMVGNQLGGVLADRAGRRATLLFGLAVGAAVMLALGFAESPGAIAGWMLALGVFGEIYRPAMQAMIADLIPTQDRSRAFGLTYWANNLGFSIASILAGLLAKVSFVWLFVGDAATTLAYGAIVLFFLAETRPATVGPRPGLEALAVPFRDRVFLGFWLLTVATASVFMQHTVSLPLAMKHDGLPPEAFGRVLAVNGVLIVLLQPWLGPVLARQKRSTVLALGVLVMGIGFGLTAWARTTPVYALTVVAWTLGEIAVLPTSGAVVADLAPLHLRGTYQGAQNLAWGLSWILGPILGTQALAGLGPGLWLGCCAVCVVVAVGHRALASALARRTAVVPSRGESVGPSG